MHTSRRPNGGNVTSGVRLPVFTARRAALPRAPALAAVACSARQTRRPGKRRVAVAAAQVQRGRRARQRAVVAGRYAAPPSPAMSPARKTSPELSAACHVIIILRHAMRGSHHHLPPNAHQFIQHGVETSSAGVAHTERFSSPSSGITSSRWRARSAAACWWQKTTPGGIPTYRIPWQYSEFNQRKRRRRQRKRVRRESTAAQRAVARWREMRRIYSLQEIRFSLYRDAASEVRAATMSGEQAGQQAGARGSDHAADVAASPVVRPRVYRQARAEKTVTEYGPIMVVSVR